MSSELSAHAHGVGFDGRLEIDAGVVPRISPRTLQTAAALALTPMIVVTFWLALTSNHLQWPVPSALYRSALVATTVVVGLCWWVRRPASRFGPLSVLLGIGIWVVTWQFSNVPLVFDIGVVAEGPVFVLVFFLFLAFPMGLVETSAARWLMIALAIVVLAFYALWALFSPAIYGVAPLIRCAPACPANVLQIGSAGRAIEVVGKVESYVVLTIIAAVFVIYAARLRSASRPRRRALVAVASTSMLYLMAAFASTLSSVILQLGPEILRTEAWIVVATRVLVPLGFLIALLQAELMGASALRSLLQRLAERPSPEQWRASVAEAVDDPALQLGYFDPITGSFLEASGRELARPLARNGRAWIAVDRAEQPVAAMVIDETLAEDPELVRAAATATLVAVENGALEGALRASQARVLQAADDERLRIRRDLHDSAQQRLVALRIHLMLAGERVESLTDRAMLEGLDDQIEQTLEDLRNVAEHGAPRLLGDDGPAVALELAAAHSAIPVTVSVHGLTRQPSEIESTIYFCCLESLQNAAKHAGREASVTIELVQRNGHITFTVEDDGAGFDPHASHPGAGLSNLTHRLSAIGGTLQIEAAPGHGSRITGTLPSGTSTRLAPVATQGVPRAHSATQHVVCQPYQGVPAARAHSSH